MNSFVHTVVLTNSITLSPERPLSIMEPNNITVAFKAYEIVAHETSAYQTRMS